MVSKFVIIESPYAANNAAKKALYVAYARMCVKDSIQRGEIPFASHLLYAQEGILDDSDPMERNKGIALGYAWMEHADFVIVYVDFGISSGMTSAVVHAKTIGKQVTYRKLFQPA